MRPPHQQNGALRAPFLQAFSVAVCVNFEKNREFSKIAPNRFFSPNLGALNPKMVPEWRETAGKPIF